MEPSPARVRALRRRVLAWYDAGKRALPWRVPQGRADPYRVWISEVMLQQTRVAAAIPFYERFTARFPTLGALAAADEQEVLALWSGLGYYGRARNLLRAAREALRAHGGLPRSVEALRALPGFGPYTAGAVASIAFAVPVPAVDGNVARVLSRAFLVRGDPAAAATRASVAALARALVDPGRPGDLNQALMDLGATICGRPAPACGRCPIEVLCAARGAGSEREVPAARRRPRRERLVLGCAIVRRGEDLLLARRPSPGLFAGMYAPPWAEIAPGEDPASTLARALRDEHALAVEVGEEVASCERVLTHRSLTLRAFRCEARGSVRATAALRFAPTARLAGLAVPSAVRALLAAESRARAGSTPSAGGRAGASRPAPGAAGRRAGGGAQRR